MEIAIRDAVRHDMPVVLKLIKELAEFEKEPDAVEVSLEELEDAGFGAQPSFRCFLAEVNETVVGMALVYHTFSTWKGTTVHLEDLIVTEAIRGKGVGEALYKRVLQFAVEKGVRRANWVVLNWNHGAVRFYERTGAKVLRDWNLVEMEAAAIKSYLGTKG